MNDTQRPRRSSSCGVQGCLWGAVLIFVVLMIAMLIIGFFRFQEPPQGIQMPAVGYQAPSPPLHALPGERTRQALDAPQPRTFRVDA